MKKRLNAVRGYCLPALPIARPKGKAIATGERSQYPLGAALTATRVDWVTKPNAKPNATTPRITRKPRVSPLVRMAAQLHQKLVGLWRGNDGGAHSGLR